MLLQQCLYTHEIAVLFCIIGLVSGLQGHAERTGADNVLLTKATNDSKDREEKFYTCM